MTVQKMLEDLIEKGFSQHAIAKRVGTTQPTIHRALKGSDTRYETGKEIEAMHHQETRPETVEHLDGIRPQEKLEHEQANPR